MQNLKKLVTTKVLLVISIHLLISCTYPYRGIECYKKEDVNIKNTYWDKEHNIFYIAYLTKLETVFYSPGVNVSASEKGSGFINVSFLRSSIHSKENNSKYKSVVGRNFVADTVIKKMLQYGETDYIVSIPIDDIGKNKICNEYIEINF